MQRIEVYDILHLENLGHVRFSAVSHESLTALLHMLDKRAIKVKFFTLQHCDNGIQAALCIDRSHVKSVQSFLFEMQIRADQCLFLLDAGIVALYGPHFVERHGIMETMHKTLRDGGVSVYAISTTVSTSSFVVASAMVPRAIELLQAAFTVPTGKA